MRFEGLVMPGVRVALMMVAVALLAGCAAQRDELWAIWDTSNPNSERRVDHEAWDRFVKHHVETDTNGVNRVAYGDVDEASRQGLQRYIGTLSAVDPRTLSRAEQLAYWINLYNALTVEVVLRHPGVPSILDMGGAGGPWRDKLLEIAGERVSLDDIEHRILRPIWRDRRIHYGLNCASVSCPNLLTAAFTASNAEALLDRAEIAYVNHRRGVSFDDRGRLTLSSIYDWYRTDFAADEEALLQYLAQVHERHGDELSSYDGPIEYAYDWALNGSRVAAE